MLEPPQPFRLSQNQNRRLTQSYFAVTHPKTTDLPLARRRLNELREEISSLTSHDAGDLTFAIVAERWQASVRHTVKESTNNRRQLCLNALTPFFAGLNLRNITPAHCERWVIDRGELISPSSFAQELDAMRAVLTMPKTKD